VPKFAMLVSENGIGLEGEWDDVLAPAVENDELAILHQGRWRHRRNDGYGAACRSLHFLHSKRPLRFVGIEEIVLFLVKNKKTSKKLLSSFII
jgi:hypothetical protein